MRHRKHKHKRLGGVPKDATTNGDTATQKFLTVDELGAALRLRRFGLMGFVAVWALAVMLIGPTLPFWVRRAVYGDSLVRLCAGKA